MSFDYHEPTSLREATELGARFGTEGRFLAGGTDLMIQIHRGRCAPRHVVSLHRALGLDAIDVDGTIALGALVTHRRLERAPAFQGALRALVESAEVVGGHQIRKVATVGGNIVNASPAADLVPVLLTLEATVTCLGPDGERTMPLDSFASGPGVTARRPDELLTRITVPRLPSRSATAFLKAGRRRAMEISLVCVAARLTLDPSFERCEEVRIALGAVAPTTMRARAAERSLEGRALTAETLREAGRIAATEALAAIDVVTEALPPILDVAAALAPGAPLVHEGWAGYTALPILHRDGNVCNRARIVGGDVEHGFEEADRIFEHRFTTPSVH